MPATAQQNFDVAIVGGGHNGLVAACLLARAGRRVVVLERREQVGGAATSGQPFPGVDARLSRYSYLVSLFPAALLRRLGISARLATRRIASYTPQGDHGLLIDHAGTRARDSLAAVSGDAGAYLAWERFYALTARVAERVFPTLTEPLRSRDQLRQIVDDETAWRALFEEPLCGVLERTFSSDLVRGVVLTDATIGTFAPADDPQLRQNRCFLYHVVGNGTGRWDVPVGGMGALTTALYNAAVGAGAEVRTATEVTAIETDEARVAVRCADGTELEARQLLANVAPTVLAKLLGEPSPNDAAEGSQLKLNMLLRRLPRLRDRDVSAEDAFAGTFHVNEGYQQLDRAFRRANAGQLPTPVPCELYCHSLSDPTILGEELRAAGAQTLTVFALHMPARLFAEDHDRAKREAVAATLRSINGVLAEPIDDCLWMDADGHPCLEALTPIELEAQVGMPGGHIFHRDLAWPFAESEDEVGSWGVETRHRNIWVCGAGARRGGGVSGIPGHNAARALLDLSRSAGRPRP